MVLIKKFAVRILFVGVALAAPQLEASIPVAVEGSDVVTGQHVTVTSSPSGKGLVVVFLSAKCPCSNSHTKELADLAAEYKEFQFVGVHSNLDESDEMGKAYFASLKFPFPVLRDKEAKIADRFKALKTPHAFILAGSAEPVFQGGMSDSKNCADAGRRYLREALSDMRGGKPPRERSVRALGCTISRRKRA